MYMIIGAGKCGTSLLADFWATPTETDKRFYCAPTVINTSVVDFQYAEKKGIPKTRWLGLRTPRQSDGYLQSVLVGSEPNFGRRIAGGMQHSFSVGFEASTAAKKELIERLPSMMPVIKQRRGGQRERMDIELAIVFFALGGGTGSGCAPVICEVCHELGIPVFAVGVLPSLSEGDSMAANAYFSIKETIKHADALILADNELIDREGGAQKFYQGFNRFIGGCVVDLFLRHLASAKKSAGLDLKTNEYTNFINAVNLGEGKNAVKGVAVLGRATANVRDLDSQGKNLKEVLVEKAFYQMSLKKLESYKADSAFFQFTFHPSLARLDFPFNKVTQEIRKQTGLNEVFDGFNTTSLRIAKLAFAGIYRPQNVERIKDMLKAAKLVGKKIEQLKSESEDIWGYEAN